jgi:hypothetical protein
MAGKDLASISKFLEAATANFCAQPKSIFSSNVAYLVPFHWQATKTLWAVPQEIESCDSVGFLPVCFIFAETSVLALWRTRKKDIIFFKCIFKLDDEDSLREEKTFKAECCELKRKI